MVDHKILKIYQIEHMPFEILAFFVNFDKLQFIKFNENVVLASRPPNLAMNRNTEWLRLRVYFIAVELKIWMAEWQ